MLKRLSINGGGKMLSWITDNLATIIVGAVVLAAVTAVLIKLIQDKRSHKSSCACGCSCKTCPYSKDCH